MGRTYVGGDLIRDDDVGRDDLNTTDTGKAVITKIIAGTGIAITETGVDDGTGDVTINASSVATGPMQSAHFHCSTDSASFTTGPVTAPFDTIALDDFTTTAFSLSNGELTSLIDGKVLFAYTILIDNFSGTARSIGSAWMEGWDGTNWFELTDTRGFTYNRMATAGEGSFSFTAPFTIAVGSKFRIRAERHDGSDVLIVRANGTHGMVLDLRGVKGDDGKSFTVDANGPIADRTSYDAELFGFSYLATDESLLYLKNSNTSGDWSVGIPFGKGDTGDTGADGADGQVGVGEGGGLSLIWAEENSALSTGTNSGYQFAFGNGANSQSGTVVGYAGIITKMVFSGGATVTAEIELYLNGIATGRIISMTAEDSKTQAVTELIITETDRITFRTISGSGGSTNVVGAVIQANGIVGDTGADGIQGIPGSDGTTWHSGSGVPADTLGNDGDFYINTSNNDYYTKVSGTWGTPIGNLGDSAFPVNDILITLSGNGIVDHLGNVILKGI